jgi:hypothetical protein
MLPHLMPSARPRRAICATVVLAAAAFVVSPLSSGVVLAQSGYLQPPAAIANVLDAPLTPLVSPNPTRTRLLLSERAGYPSIAEVAAPEYRLAGLRFDPRSNGPSRGSGVRALSVMPIAGGEAQRITVPWPAGTDTTG